MTDLPNFRSRAFLLEHLQKTMDFYHPRGFDPTGGFFTTFGADGTVLDRHARSLVHTCRFLFNEANAYLEFGRAVSRGCPSCTRFSRFAAPGACNAGLSLDFPLRGWPP